MARKTIIVSDLSGEQIQDGKGATVRIKFDDARKGMIILDVTCPALVRFSTARLSTAPSCCYATG